MVPCVALPCSRIGVDRDLPFCTYFDPHSISHVAPWISDALFLELAQVRPHCTTRLHSHLGVRSNLQALQLLAGQ